MKHIPAMLSAVGVAFAVAGCSGPPEAAQNTAPEGAPVSTSATSDGSSAATFKTVKPGEKVKVAFITNNPSDYWTIAHKGCDKADAELPDLEYEWRVPARGTAPEQTQIVDDLLSKGVQGFAISPVDPAGQTSLLNSAAAKALVITQDSDAANSNRACYVGTDNHAAGVQAGEEIKKALPNGGEIMVFVGSRDAQNAHDRYTGIEDALKGSKVTIKDLRTDGTDHGKAKDNASDTLTKYPNIAALVGLWSYNGPAILDAVKDAGKVGKVKIVCFDEEKATVAGVKSGAISATIVQQPYKFGYESLKLMDKVLHGDLKALPANKQIIIPTRAITTANIAAFEVEMNKLRAGK